MIVSTSYERKTAAVLGLSRTGLSACRSLEAAGAEVLAWDDNPNSRKQAAEQGCAIADLDHADWSRIDSLVTSPGIPLTHPQPHRLVRLATAAGVPVIGDMELLAIHQPRRRIVGVTGTNGKSTTSALVAHILRRASIGTQLGGNIGLPVLDLLPKPDGDIYVLELSSYQLDLTERLKCAVAVILNISADHLDRHGGMAGYVQAKRRILRNQEASDWVVIGIDDDYGQAIFNELRADNDRKIAPISARGRAPGGVAVKDGRLIDDLDGEARAVGDLSSITHLQGVHNWQNAAAAYAAVRAFGLEPEGILEGMASFPGLPHRMELVGEVDHIRFINDSKATNPDAAARSLACFRPIYWIAGGKAKQDDLDAVLPYLDRIEHAFLIGEAAPLFEKLLKGEVETTIAGTLDQAVETAVAKARLDGLEGAAVLLAPACASFDQFRDFEARGDAFRTLVESLKAPPRQTAAVGGGGG